MSDSIASPPVSCKIICEDCAFYVKLECTHPDELVVNCATVIFCNSFTPAVEVDSPCVSFGSDDEENQKSAIAIDTRYCDRTLRNSC